MRVLINLAFVVAAATAAATPRPTMVTAAAITMDCNAPAAASAGTAVNLHGNWDFLMDVGGTPSFGVLSIGLVDGGYGGSLTPVATAPVVVRSITVSGNAIHMVVASREGDVMYDGVISRRNDRICGTVTYHDGRRFPMLVQRRPSTYQTRPVPARQSG